jgi:hypothetical protein
MKSEMKPAYLEKADQRGDFAVWIVDGSYIRGHIDEEFTNFGQHYRYSYIPKMEFWIDKEAQHDERQFFIDHLLTEYELMRKGITYEKALSQADTRERVERRRAGDVRKMTQSGKKLPDGHDVHDRSAFDIDFTEGGHDFVYEFVPENEVWIDDAIMEPERPYVLLHELHERNRMSSGWSYNKAHAESSHIEYRCRHHPDELHDALSAEGWA